MPTPGGKYLLIRIDSRLPERAVVAQLAHELYHAVEIARGPASSTARLSRACDRIGRRGCYQQVDTCWETDAARLCRVGDAAALRAAAYRWQRGDCKVEQSSQRTHPRHRLHGLRHGRITRRRIRAEDRATSGGARS